MADATGPTVPNTETPALAAASVPGPASSTEPKPVASPVLEPVAQSPAAQVHQFPAAQVQSSPAPSVGMLKRLPVMKTLVFALVAVIAVMLGFTNVLRKPQMLGVKYPLDRNVQFPPRCTPILPVELENGRFMSNTVQQQELYDSLIFHILARDEQIMCAQHVGLPLCYCVMRTEKAFDQYGRPQRYLELVNLQLSGITGHKQVHHKETAMECDREYWTHRHTGLLVSYLAIDREDQKAVVIDREFGRQQTPLISYAMELQYQLPSHCGKADGAEVLSFWLNNKDKIKVQPNPPPVLESGGRRT